MYCDDIVSYPKYCVLPRLECVCVCVWKGGWESSGIDDELYPVSALTATVLQELQKPCYRFRFCAGQRVIVV